MRSATVTQIYPTHDQVRNAMDAAVRDAVAATMASYGMGRFREFHLRGGLEGVVDALTHFCCCWVKPERIEDGAPDLADDLADLLREQVKDLVAMILQIRAEKA